MRLVFVTQLSVETNIGVGFEHVRHTLDFHARGFIEDSALAGSGSVAFFFTAHAAHFAAGADDDGVEEPGLSQPTRGELLQSNAERKHGDQRGHAHGNADCGQRIPQQGFAQVAQGQFGEVGNFHRCTPLVSAAAVDGTFGRSSISFPSARKIIRRA